MQPDLLGLPLLQAKKKLAQLDIRYDIMITKPPRHGQLGEQIRVVGQRCSKEGIVLICAYTCKGLSDPLNREGV